MKLAALTLLWASLAFAGEQDVLPRRAFVPDTGGAPADLQASGRYAALQGRRVVLELSDGQRLIGTLKRARQGEVVLRLMTGIDLTVPDAGIKAISLSTQQLTAEGWHADRNRVRYLYGPSAMMLKQGEVYFSQKELIASELGIGLTDFLNTTFGSALPAFIGGPTGFNFFAQLKAGTELVPRLHLAVGVQALFLGAFGSSGGFPLGLAPYGVITYGTPNVHFSVSTAVPIGIGELARPGADAVNHPMVAVSANFRFAKVAALITENWLIPGTSGQFTGLNDGFTLSNAVGVRLFGEQFACDLGLVVTSNERGVLQPVFFPLPWVDFTWNFN